MLHAHPRIAIPPETRHLLEVYRRRERWGDLRQDDNHEKLARFIVRHRKFPDLKLDKAATRRKIVQGPPTVGSALGIVLEEYAARFGKPRWGDKRPLYLNHLPVIFALFPDAQVIHIIRDGRACVASLKRMPWFHGGAIQATSRWVQSMRMGDRARRTYRPDQYFELQYEQLVADPRAELTRLCTFLGEDFAETMLEPSEVAPEAVPDRKAWHANTHGAVSTAPVKAWERELERWEVAVFEALGRRWLRRYGYPLTTSRRQAPPHRLAMATVHLLKRERSVFMDNRNDGKRAKRYAHPVAAQLTRGQRALAEQRGELLPAPNPPVS